MDNLKLGLIAVAIALIAIVHLKPVHLEIFIGLVDSLRKIT